MAFIKYLSKLIILFGVLSACMHRPLPNLPKNWTGEVVSKAVFEDQTDVASMHVMIMYGSTVCNHTASRYYCPGKGAAFWDPGGGYGREGYVKVHKSRNVVIENVPTVNDYLYWRTLIPTASTEVFSWQGKDKEAQICKLFDMLKSGSQGAPINNFKPATAGMFCSAATSEFLRDFAGELMQVDKWGLPHNLSKQLHNNKSADTIHIVDTKTGTIKRYHPQ